MEENKTQEVPEMPIKAWVAVLTLAMALAGVAVHYGMWKGKADLRFENQAESNAKLESRMDAIAKSSDENAKHAIALLRQEQLERERGDNQTNMSIMSVKNAVDNNQKGISENNALLRQLINVFKAGD